MAIKCTVKWIFVSIVSFLTLVMIFPVRASAVTLSGGWACLWHLTVQVQTGTNSFPIFNFNQLMQLNVTGTGNLTGSLFYSFPNGSTVGGEVCEIAINSGSMSAAPNGVGNLSVTFSVSSTAKDEDKDVPCTAVFGTGSLTESFRFVTASSNTKLYFIGKDPFLTPTPGDTEFPSISGVCEHQ